MTADEYLAKLRKKFPVAMHGRVEKVPTSRRAAMTLFCIECMGFQPGLIDGCTAKECPLFLWRPFQKDREKKATTPENLERLQRARATLAEQRAASRAG